MSSYDTWKTTDWRGESQQEDFEKAEQIISDNGCDKCGNENTDEFENVQTETWKEGKHNCFSVSATCKECDTEFEYSSAPDWDSMRKDY